MPSSQENPSTTETAQTTETTQTTSQNPFIDATSLYVGDLPKIVTKPLLDDTFNKVAPVESSRICFDSITGESRGYAFVNFKSHEDAKKAKEVLSNLVFDNQCCRIAWQLSDSQRTALQKSNIFIKNLPKSISASVLSEICSAFGPVFTAKAVHTPLNATGYGFVQYEKEEDAQLAIKKMNGAKVNGILLSACLFESKSKRASATSKIENTFTNVFVKNIPVGSSKTAITKLFEEYGEITSSYFPSGDGDSDSCQRAYAIFNYKTHEQAVEAVNKLNEYEFEPSVKFYVSRHKTKYERQMEIDRRTQEWKRKFTGTYGGYNLYVAGLDAEITNEKLRDLFAKYGTPGSIKVEQGADGKCRGFGYVYFPNSEEGRRAESELNGAVLDGRHIRVCAHQPRVKRFNMLTSQYSPRDYFMMRSTKRFPDEGLQMPSIFGRSGAFYNMRVNPDIYQPGFSMPQGYPYGSRDRQEMHSGDTYQGTRPVSDRRVGGYAPKNVKPVMNMMNVQSSEEFPISIPEGVHPGTRPPKTEMRPPYSKAPKGPHSNFGMSTRHTYNQPYGSSQAQNRGPPKFMNERDNLSHDKTVSLDKIKTKLHNYFSKDAALNDTLNQWSKMPTDELIKIANNEESFNSKIMELRGTEGIINEMLPDGNNPQVIS